MVIIDFGKMCVCDFEVNWVVLVLMEFDIIIIVGL
jgi:hypothetical protein